MRKVIHYFAKNGRVTLLLVLFVLIAGLAGLFYLRRESFPAVDFAIVTIETIYPGASPDEVEDLITLKIEKELRGVDGIRDVKSTSQAGTSEIVVRIELDNVDIQQTADEVQRAVQRATDLPAEIPEPPKITRVDSGEIPVLEFGIVEVERLVGRVRDRVAEDLEDILEDVPGVAEVRLSGYRPREFTIRLDQEKMRRLAVSNSEVREALSAHLQNIPGGYIKRGRTERLVRVLGKTADKQAIEQVIIVGTLDGGAVRMKDLGEVIDGSAEPEILARVNGERATLLTVTKKSTADTIDVVDELQKRLNDYERRMPEGLRFLIYNNERARVQNQLNIVVSNAVMGLIFILTVLLILLPGTIGVVASLSLPLTIFALTASMIAFGLTFNTITMIATVIVLGLLVDNSAVVAEAYARNRSVGMDTLTASTRAADIFFVPILATVLCNVAGFAPMLITSGILGQFIYSIPVIITLALAFSMVETFLLLPARLRLTLRRTPPPPPEADHFERGWFGSIQRSFKRLLLILLHRRFLTMTVVGIIFVISLLVTVFLNRFELFPKDDAEIFTGRFEAPLGASIERTDALAREFSVRVMRQLEEDGIPHDPLAVRTGISRVGFDDPQGNVAHNVGFIYWSIPLDEIGNYRTADVLRSLERVKPEGVRDMQWEEHSGGPPVGLPLNVIFRSTNETQLLRMVNAFKDEIKKVEGVYNIGDDLVRRAQEYDLDLNVDLLRRAGLSLEDVGRAVRTALQGEVVSILNLRGREVEVRIRYQPEDRVTVDDLKQITLLTPDEGHLPIGKVASIRLVEGPVVRKRFDFQRSVTVTAEVEPEVITSIELNARAREIIHDLQKMFPDVSYIAGGEEENTRESFRSLMSALVLAIVAILGILVVVYQSFGQSFLILSTIPLGLAGVSYVFWFAGRPLSFMALIGVISLSGVVVNASVVLVSFINDARRDRPRQDLISLVSEVTALRFKAIFITNATTVMGLIPTAYGFGGDDPFLVPLTLAMGWGLIIGSTLAIIWIPCGYLALEDVYRWFREFQPRKLLTYIIPPKKSVLFRQSPEHR